MQQLILFQSIAFGLQNTFCEIYVMYLSTLGEMAEVVDACLASSH